MNTILSRILASETCRTCVASRKVHIHREDSCEFAILERENAAEENFQIAMLPSLIKSLVGEKSEFFARYSLRRDGQEIYLWTRAVAQFAQDESLTLREDRIAFVF